MKFIFEPEETHVITTPSQAKKKGKKIYFLSFWSPEKNITWQTKWVNLHKLKLNYLFFFFKFIIYNVRLEYIQLFFNIS